MDGNVMGNVGCIAGFFVAIGFFFALGLLQAWPHIGNFMHWLVNLIW